MPSTSNSSTEGAPAPLLEIGYISKAHGLGGDVVVHLTTDRVERLDAGSKLTTVRGVRQVEEARRDGVRWLVRFTGVNDRETADALRGDLMAERLEVDDGTLWVHELIGCRVVDAAGDHGVVVSVLENPASDLLELDTGPLVPLRFVIGGPADGVVTVEVPEGLWDLTS